jgi:hypothetical protein
MFQTSMSIWYGATIEISYHNGFHRSRTMGLRWPEYLQKCRKFHRSVRQTVERRKKKRIQGKTKNVAVHLGLLTYKVAFTEFKLVGGSFFFPMHGLPCPLSYVRQASCRHRASVSYRQIGCFRKQRMRVQERRLIAYFQRLVVGNLYLVDGRTLARPFK